MHFGRPRRYDVDFVDRFRNLTVLEDVLALVMFEKLQLKTKFVTIFATELIVISLKLVILQFA